MPTWADNAARAHEIGRRAAAGDLHPDWQRHRAPTAACVLPARRHDASDASLCSAGASCSLRGKRDRARRRDRCERGSLASAIGYACVPGDRTDTAAHQ
eukprot:4506265-Prymnesium_polylepis.1